MCSSDLAVAELELVRADARRQADEALAVEADAVQVPAGRAVLRALEPQQAARRVDATNPIPRYLRTVELDVRRIGKALGDDGPPIAGSASAGSVSPRSLFMPLSIDEAPLPSELVLLLCGSCALPSP